MSQVINVAIDRSMFLFIYVLYPVLSWHLASIAHGASGFMTVFFVKMFSWRRWHSAAGRWHASYSAFTDEAAELLIA